jgi:hypothetical protein
MSYQICIKYQQKTKCWSVLNHQQNMFFEFFEKQVNPLSSKVMPVFYLTYALCMCNLQYLWDGPTYKIYIVNDVDATKSSS